MSEKNLWLFRIKDILHSIDRIEKLVAGMKFDAYSQDENLQDITARRFQIIGEAARKIPDAIKAHHSELPWSKMIGLRNFVVHEYNNVDQRLIWDTIHVEFPKLKADLHLLLAEEKE